MFGDGSGRNPAEIPLICVGAITVVSIARSNVIGAVTAATLGTSLLIAGCGGGHQAAGPTRYQSLEAQVDQEFARENQREAGVLAPGRGGNRPLIVSLVPVRRKRNVLFFKLKGLRARGIRSARLTSRTLVVPVPLGRVRKGARTGRLGLKSPPQLATASATRGPVRLAITLAGPKGSPAQGTTGPTTPTTGAPDVATGPKGARAPRAVASGAQPNPACAPSYGSFTSDNQPPGCWRPYATASPFNRQVTASSREAPNSAATVGRLLGFGGLQNLLAGQAGTSNDFYRPLYYSRASDPTFTLHCTNISWGVCPLEGLLIHVPDAARAPGGTDAHMTVIDQSAGVEYDLWQVSSKPSGGGVLQFSWGGKTAIDGAGLGSGAVAAEFGTAAGLLREQELEAGQINHALLISVHCDSGAFVYPAAKGGRACSDLGESNANAPAEGTRFQLTMTDAQIDALGVPDWKKTILRAMSHYGLIVGDTGGSWQLEAESALSHTSFGTADKWVEFAKSVGVPHYAPDNDWVFNVNNGVDWGRYLRVVDPCVSQGTC